MYLTNIKRLLSLPHAIERYNKEFDTRLGIHHVRLIMIIHLEHSYCDRATIIEKMHARSLTTNYTHLNAMIEKLIEENLIIKYDRKYFRTTTNGAYLLKKVDTWVKQYRWDRIGQKTLKTNN